MQRGKVGGSILLLVLTVMAALLIMGGALLAVTLTESRIVHNQEQDLKLYYITEAGIEAGVAALQVDGGWEGPLGGSLGGGNYFVEFVDEPGLPREHPYRERLPQRLEGGRRLVISTGTFEGRIMVLAVIVERAGEEESGPCAGTCDPVNNSGHEGVVIAEWINPWRP